LLLEGPDIEQLLARVRDEHGGHARIVSAEKVRTGGLGGFFARQRFELAVEVDDEDLYEGEASVGKNGTANGRATARAAAPAAAGSSPSGSGSGSGSPSGSGSAGPASAGPASVQDLIAMVDAQEQGLAPGGIAGVAGVAGMGVPGGAAGPAGVTGSAAPRLSGASALAAAAASEAMQSVAVVPAPAAVPGTMPGTGVALGSATIGGLPAPYRGVVMPGGLARPVAALLALGLPEALAVRAVGPDRYAAVLTAVGGLPPAPPPPDAAGEILCLVGDVSAGAALGAALSELQYLDATRLLVAGPIPAGTGVPPARRILGPDDAARRAGKLRAGDTPRVIVVAAPVDGRSAEWAHAVLAALRPTATWALVDATRKIADTVRHLSELGDLDAIAVHSASVTADPGSILGLTLELGIPIGFLDGRPATAEEWAALLCARMTDQG
jgi:hypothetical protein